MRRRKGRYFLQIALLPSRIRFTLYLRTSANVPAGVPMTGRAGTDTGVRPDMSNGADLPSPPPEEDFRRLMERVRAGCPDAAKEVCRRYGGHIRVMVRRRLSRRMRPQYDSLDFLQDVWASFFAAPPAEGDLDDPQLLIRHLSRLALNKVADEYRRRFRVKKRDARREQPLGTAGLNMGRSVDPPVRDPTPSQVAIANEHWEYLVRSTPNRYRLVLEMLRLGYTHAEIAERTELHVKVIQRLVQRMAQRRDAP